MNDTKGNEYLFINSFLPEKSKFNLCFDVVMVVTQSKG